MDPDQIRQVLLNLFLNAIQAVQEKGHITIQGDQQTHNGYRVAVVEIQDDGPGIKASDVDKVFQPFYSTKETGFGLGLFISSIIVERHSGMIKVESREGLGTHIKV